MRFENGYPIIQGASDAEDSSHLAGILVLTEHPQAPDMRQYLTSANGPGVKYQRSPNAKYDVSGDQAILIMSALLIQGHKEFVRTDFIDGKDIIRPSTHGIETIARGQRPTWLQRNWLIGELKFDGESIEEPFQNFAKCRAYDYGTGKHEWLKLWTQINPVYDVAIYNYLCGGKNKWRGEKDLFDHVIKYIEDKIK